MIFLIPLLLIIGIIFGIDYMYFKNENKTVQTQIKKQDFNVTLEEEKKRYIKNLFKAN